MTDLTLKQVIEDPQLCAGFAQFCDTTHARENFDFWVEVVEFEAFAKDALTGEQANVKRVSTMFGRFLTASRMTMVLSPRSAAQRKSTPGGELVTPRDRALRIMTVYLSPDSPKWVCVDLALAQGLSAKV